MTANKFEHLGAMAWNNEGQMYIMRGHVNEMPRTKIPYKRVVQPLNGKYFTGQDGPHWMQKSMDICV
jgi:hypothetical protein